MDKQEAADLLKTELAKYRQMSYSQQLARINEIDNHEVTGPSGTEYQIETQVFWDGKPDGNIRVFAGIDDGGWRAFSPLPDDFVMSPDGHFLGE